MSNTTDALSNARGDAQALHNKIQITTAKDHAAVRAHFEDVAKQAQALAQSVKALTESRQSDARQHLRDAATVLESAAREAKELAGAANTDVRQANAILRARTTTAAQLISRAVAVERANRRLVQA